MSWQIAASLNAEMIFRATKEAYLRDGFGPNKRFSAFVAECDHKIIGMVTYSDRYSTALASPVVYVQDIFVDGEHRRGGVAKALLACVATEAVKQGSAAH